MEKNIKCAPPPQNEKKESAHFLFIEGVFKNIHQYYQYDENAPELKKNKIYTAFQALFTEKRKGLAQLVHIAQGAEELQAFLNKHLPELEIGKNSISIGHKKVTQQEIKDDVYQTACEYITALLQKKPGANGADYNTFRQRIHIFIADWKHVYQLRMGSALPEQEQEIFIWEACRVHCLHMNNRRENGDHFIEHFFAACNNALTSAAHPDHFENSEDVPTSERILTNLLHDTIEDTTTPLSDILFPRAHTQKGRFSQEIIFLLKTVQKSVQVLTKNSTLPGKGRQRDEAYFRILKEVLKGNLAPLNSKLDEGLNNAQTLFHIGNIRKRLSNIQKMIVMSTFALFSGRLNTRNSFIDAILSAELGGYDIPQEKELGEIPNSKKQAAQYWEKAALIAENWRVDGQDTRFQKAPSTILDWFNNRVLEEEKLFFMEQGNSKNNEPTASYWTQMCSLIRTNPRISTHMDDIEFCTPKIGDFFDISKWKQPYQNIDPESGIIDVQKLHTIRITVHQNSDIHEVSMGLQELYKERINLAAPPSAKHQKYLFFAKTETEPALRFHIVSKEYQAPPPALEKGPLVQVIQDICNMAGSKFRGVFAAILRRLSDPPVKLTSPQGETKDFPAGACAFDFVHAVHTQLVLGAQRAKLNVGFGDGKVTISPFERLRDGACLHTETGAPYSLSEMIGLSQHPTLLPNTKATIRKQFNSASEKEQTVAKEQYIANLSTAFGIPPATLLFCYKERYSCSELLDAMFNTQGTYERICKSQNIDSKTLNHLQIFQLFFSKDADNDILNKQIPEGSRAPCGEIFFERLQRYKKLGIEELCKKHTNIVGILKDALVLEYGKNYCEAILQVFDIQDEKTQEKVYSELKNLFRKKHKKIKKVFPQHLYSALTRGEICLFTAIEKVVGEKIDPYKILSNIDAYWEGGVIEKLETKHQIDYKNKDVSADKFWEYMKESPDFLHNFNWNLQIELFDKPSEQTYLFTKAKHLNINIREMHIKKKDIDEKGNIPSENTTIVEYLINTKDISRSTPGAIEDLMCYFFELYCEGYTFTLRKQNMNPLEKMAK